MSDQGSKGTQVELYNILISMAILSLLFLDVGWRFLFTLWKAVAGWRITDERLSLDLPQVQSRKRL